MKTTPEVVLHGIGADPEFVFGRRREWALSVVPAKAVLNVPKGPALESYIGVDGHAETAEFRPRPGFNVYRLLMELAYAITYTRRYLVGTRYGPKGDTPVELYAAPMVANEPLGGHVHVSYFTRSPDLARLHHVFNATLGKGSAGELYDASVGHVGGTGSELNELIERVRGADADNRLAGPVTLHGVMAYLNLPLENWAPSAILRQNRFAKYGPTAGDPIRRFHSKPKVRLSKCGDPDIWAYLHWEYRVPSTWLNHPSHAYLHLACMKLVMLNFGTVIELYNALPAQLALPVSGVEGAVRNFKLFLGRLELLRRECRSTPDTKKIEEVAHTLMDNRDVIMNPAAPIDYTAWEKFLE